MFTKTGTMENASMSTSRMECLGSSSPNQALRLQEELMKMPSMQLLTVKSGWCRLTCMHDPGLMVMRVECSLIQAIVISLRTTLST